MRTPKTPDALLELAREQMYFLISSSDAFDAGRVAEAKRLAVTLRVLLHSTSNSHALLDQTQHRDQLRFLDTAGELDDNNLLSKANLVAMEVSMQPDGTTHGAYVPVLGMFRRSQQPDPHRQVRALLEGRKEPRRPGLHFEFERWWAQEVIGDNHGHTFSRRRLVLALANEEGGAHVDPQSRADYQAVANSNSLGWSYSGSESDSPMPSPVPACVRQISWEVHTTVLNQAPELIPPELRHVRPRQQPRIS